MVGQISAGLIVGGSFAFQNGLGSQNSLKQLENVTLTDDGLIFGRAYYRMAFCE